MRNGVMTKELKPGMLQTKRTNPARLKAEGKPAGGAARAYSQECDGHHVAYLLGWSAFDALPSAVAKTAGILSSFGPMTYVPRDLSAYDVPTPDYGDLDAEGVASHVRKLETAITKAQNERNMAGIYAHNAEINRDAVASALESIAESCRSGEFARAYDDAVTHAEEGCRAFDDIVSRLTSQLEEARTHLPKSTAAITDELDELRRQVAELMANRS